MFQAIFPRKKQQGSKGGGTWRWTPSTQKQIPTTPTAAASTLDIPAAAAADADYDRLESPADIQRVRAKLESIGVLMDDLFPQIPVRNVAWPRPFLSHAISETLAGCCLLALSPAAPVLPIHRHTCWSMCGCRHGRRTLVGDLFDVGWKANTISPCS
jgi:hypothetical protein